MLSVKESCATYTFDTLPTRGLKKETNMSRETNAMHRVIRHPANPPAGRGGAGAQSCAEGAIGPIQRG